MNSSSMKKNQTSFQIESIGMTDVGLVRENNEDVWAELIKEHCFILADGMGGHQAGEVAAQKTVDLLSDYIKAIFEAKKTTPEEVSDLLRRAIIDTNRRIYQLSLEKREYQGMGTTLCVAFIHSPYLIFAHVGDSRIYRIRHQKIERLTRDHSLKDELISKGELLEEDAPFFPYRNIITRAIGTQPLADPEVQTTLMDPQDIYFLCSDGLTDNLLDREMLEIILTAPTLKKAAETLIQKAKNKGGADNITVVMFRHYFS